MPLLVPRAARQPQRYEQGCSKQATSDKSEKANVGFVVRHLLLLHDNHAGTEAFPQVAPQVGSQHLKTCCRSGWMSAISPVILGGIDEALR